MQFRGSREAGWRPRLPEIVRAAIGLYGEVGIRKHLGMAEELLAGDVRASQLAGRFEEESLAFHGRVRGGYLKLAEREPDRFCVIDATAPIDGIAQQIWSIVSEKLPGPSDAGPPELKL